VRTGGTLTDADGLASLAATGAGPRLRVVAASERHGVAVVETQLAPAAEQRGDQLFLYTERPIYRPGQRLFWKLFARVARGEGLALPPAGPATLELHGPDGASLDVASATLSA